MSDGVVVVAGVVVFGFLIGMISRSISDRWEKRGSRK